MGTMDKLEMTLTKQVGPDWRKVWKGRKVSSLDQLSSSCGNCGMLEVRWNGYFGALHEVRWQTT
jgi:hypothetical protein